MAAALPFFDKSKPFSDIGLDRRVFKAVAKLGFIYPTIAQSQVISPALEGRDILCQAKTGSGKTLAYSIPLVQLIIQSTTAQDDGGDDESFLNRVAGLVLVPTRELVDQVKRTIQSLLFYCDGVTVMGLSGSQTIEVQVAQLANTPTILVATPTRLVELCQRKAVDISHIQMLVIDEADLVLSYGFEDDLQKVLGSFQGKPVQTCLLSATTSGRLKRLAASLLSKPVTLTLNTQAAGELKQFYLETSDKDKYLLAYCLLRLQVISGKTLIFVNSIETAFRLKLFLELFSITTALLNHELPANSRRHIIEQFNRGLFDYLIATDEGIEYEEEQENEEDVEGQDDDSEEVAVDDHKEKELTSDSEDVDEDEEDSASAQGHSDSDDDAPKSKKAKTSSEEKKENEVSSSCKSKTRSAKGSEFGASRGIDFKGVKAVLNFDFPESVASYTHRIGRTARAGQAGVALALVVPGDVARLEETRDHQQALLARGEGNTVLAALQFDRSQVEAFRYRVEDVSRGVTKAAVREARLKEVRLEMLNSEKLNAHFEDNPKELELLKHAKVLRPSKVNKALASIPSYLIPSHADAKIINSAAFGVDGDGKSNKKKFKRNWSQMSNKKKPPKQTR